MKYHGYKHKKAQLPSEVAYEDEANTFTGTQTFNGIIDMNGNRITDLGTPTADTDASTKQYVDNLVAGLDWQESVKSATVLDPTALTPSDGDRYLINGTGAGAWVGQDDNIAQWDDTGSAWVYTSPNDGMAVFAEDTDLAYVYNGTAWNNFASMGSHNSLAGLQGGTTNEYYHLTSTEHGAMTGGTTSDASAEHTHDTFPLTGHDHDGVNSKQVDYSNLANVPSNIVTEEGTMSFLYCSQTDGSDTTGDGSRFNPYASIQKCIDQIGEDEHKIIIVDDNESCVAENVTLPDATSYKSASITSHSSFTTWWGKIGTLTVGNNWSIILDDMYISAFAESGSTSWAQIWLEECYILNAINLPNTEVWLLGTYTDRDPNTFTASKLLGYAVIQDNANNDPFWTSGFINGIDLPNHSHDGTSDDGPKIVFSDILNTEHASTHSDGGTDEIDVADLGATALATDSYLWNDGSGGVAWKATKPTIFGFDELGSTSTSWIKHGAIIFTGTTKMGSVNKIYINAYITAITGGSTYEVRVQDVTNGNTICSITAKNNTTIAIQDMGTISNLPTGQALFEVQTRRVGGSSTNTVVTSGGIIEW